MTTASTARALDGPPASTGGLSGWRRNWMLVCWIRRWTRVVVPSESLVARYMTGVRSRPLPGAPGTDPSADTGAETVMTQSVWAPTAATGPGERSSTVNVYIFPLQSPTATWASLLEALAVR